MAIRPRSRRSTTTNKSLCAHGGSHLPIFGGQVASTIMVAVGDEMAINIKKQADIHAAPFAAYADREFSKDPTLRAVHLVAIAAGARFIYASVVKLGILPPNVVATHREWIRPRKAYDRAACHVPASAARGRDTQIFGNNPLSGVAPSKTGKFMAALKPVFSPAAVKKGGKNGGPPKSKP